MTDEVRRYLHKAEHAIKVAADQFNDGHIPDAASKTYYAAQAALNADGIDVVRHSAAEAPFGFHYAKTGKIDPKFHRMLMNARKIREIADYDTDEEILEPVASLKIDEGRAFLWAIKDYLGM